jgi:hypothetical protein
MSTPTTPDSPTTPSAPDAGPDEPVLVPPRSDSDPLEGEQPSAGNNQDVGARKIYPTDPTGDEPGV